MSTPEQSYTVTLFSPGNAEAGFRMIEKAGWDGEGLLIPRRMLSVLLKNPERKRQLDQPGVYLLLAPEEEQGLPRIYIGEADPLSERLVRHVQDPPEGILDWEEAVAFTTFKPGRLNKAHIQHLEARLLSMAREAKRCSLANKKKENEPTLSERDRMEAETFLESLTLCMEILKLDVFHSVAKAPVQAPQYFLRSKGVDALALDAAEGFLVLKGSKASKKMTPSVPLNVKMLREGLLSNGVLKEEGEFLVFTDTYKFGSPSTAAGVVLGASVNGLEQWKNEQGTTLKDVQSAQLQGYEAES